MHIQELYGKLAALLHDQCTGIPIALPERGTMPISTEQVHGTSAALLVPTADVFHTAFYCSRLVSELCTRTNVARDAGRDAI